MSYAAMTQILLVVLWEVSRTLYISQICLPDNILLSLIIEH